MWKADSEPHAVNMVFGGGIMSVRMFAIPNVGERIQIQGRDFRVASRDWTIDAADDRTLRSARVVLRLEHTE